MLLSPFFILPSPFPSPPSLYYTFPSPYSIIFIIITSSSSFCITLGLFRVSGDHNLLSLVKTRLEPSWTGDKKQYSECVIIGMHLTLGIANLSPLLYYHLLSSLLFSHQHLFNDTNFFLNIDNLQFYYFFSTFLLLCLSLPHPCLSS